MDDQEFIVEFEMRQHFRITVLATDTDQAVSRAMDTVSGPGQLVMRKVTRKEMMSEFDEGQFEADD